MTTELQNHLDQLRLPFIKQHCHDRALLAAKKSQPHLDYLAGLIEGESV